MGNECSHGLVCSVEVRCHNICDYFMHQIPIKYLGSFQISFHARSHNLLAP